MPAHGVQFEVSNRLETLAARLAAFLGAGGGDPFEPDLVLVQSLGMERWVRLQLAARLGVCANLRFPFPRAFAWGLFRQLDAAPASVPAWEPDALAWRLFARLPEWTQRDAFGPLRQYLENDPDARKRWQLAARLARLLDQYGVYRPDMVLRWEEGARVGGNDAERHDPATEAWQSQLWRDLAAEIRQPSPARLRRLLFERFDALRLSARLAIFGISALPPFYLELLERLGARCEVRIFLLQPCREYWADLPGKLEARRQSLDVRFAEADTRGNRLLASLGTLGRDFLRVALDTTEFNAAEHFHEPEPGRLLATVQADVLALRDRGRDPEAPPLPLDPADDSIRVHSCHGPLRELEVLRDHLLDWFQRDATLQPRDVLVMIPDLPKYAPLVQAVFGAGHDGEARIPFSLADLAPGHGSSAVAAFRALLELPRSRFGAAEILDLLETPAVRARFGFAEGDLPQLREWTERAGIRWGRDAAHRESLGLPAFAQNSWRAGLDRLLLGVALPGRAEPVGGVLACDGAEGRTAEALGRFATFIESLFALAMDCAEPRPVRAWVARLRQALRDFFEDADGDSQLGVLRDALRALDESALAADAEGPVPFSVITEALAPRLDNDDVRGGYLTGRVTFSAMKPMRSLPFRVIALVGMEDGAFPRTDPQLAFDLMARAPRPGDLRRRDDDRYLFLETLLSARDRLHISYVGQSQRDNSDAPPSVLVSELLDVLDDAFTPGGAQAYTPVSAATAQPSVTRGRVRDRIVVKHPLQAFHASCFNGADPRRFSYSQENLRAARAALSPRVQPAFAATPLPEPPPEFRTVRVDDLAEFFANPSRFFARHRLGLRLPRADEAPGESEPMELAGRERYAFDEELMRELLRGSHADVLHARWQAAGKLPPGVTGESQWRARLDDLGALLEHARDWRAGEPCPLAADFAAGPFRVTGDIGMCWPAGLLHARPTRIKGRDRVRAWVRHLALCALPGADAKWRTLILGHGEKEPERVTLRHVTDAPARLEQLLELYWRGLSQPLPFFPESAWAWMHGLKGGRTPSPERAAEMAQKQWGGDDASDFVQPESADEHFALCFGDGCPLGEDFEQLARAVFEPFMEHREK